MRRLDIVSSFPFHTKDVELLSRLADISSTTLHKLLGKTPAQSSDQFSFERTERSGMRLDTYIHQSNLVSDKTAMVIQLPSSKFIKHEEKLVRTVVSALLQKAYTPGALITEPTHLERMNWFLNGPFLDGGSFTPQVDSHIVAITRLLRAALRKMPFPDIAVIRLDVVLSNGSYLIYLRYAPQPT